MNFFVDQKLLETCLKNAHPDSEIMVCHFEDGQYVVEPGTNYSSEIVRVCVNYVCDGKPLYQCLVFKVPFLSGHYEFLNELGFYDKETYMYDKVFPRMRTMLCSAVIPRHFLTTGRHILALEDLCVQGYYLCNQAALDYEHCASTYRGLAMFHAASIKLHLEDEHLIEPATHEALYTKDIVSKTMCACIPVLVNVLRKEGISAAVLHNFATYEQRINNACNICQPTGRRCHFNVLNHGDLKTNNILFKNEGQGQPISVKLLDYQTCRWNSPVLDLIFFNMATMNYEVYEKQFDQLLDEYLTTLKETLDKIGGINCTYTRNDYEMDSKAFILFQVFTLVWIGFLDIREAIEGFDYHKIIQLKEDQLEKISTNDLFQIRFMNWFRNFEGKGFFAE